MEEEILTVVGNTEQEVEVEVHMKRHINHHVLKKVALEPQSLDGDIKK